MSSPSSNLRSVDSSSSGADVASTTCRPRAATRAQKFAGTGQYTKQRCGVFVVPGMQFRRTLLGVFTCLRGQGLHQLGSVHADRPVYAPRLHPNADLSEGPAPWVNVQRVGVDQGAVDVEQHAAVPELMRPGPDHRVGSGLRLARSPRRHSASTHRPPFRRFRTRR